LVKWSLKPGDGRALAILVLTEARQGDQHHVPVAGSCLIRLATV
jgi:hypothetical protein